MPANWKTIFRWCQYLLMCAGSAVLSYCAGTVIEEVRFQRQASATMTTRSTTKVVAASADMIGKLVVPHAHVDTVISEGTSAAILRIAVGHVAGTALPGERGNIALAAHRDVFFRHLGDLRSGDVISVVTPSGRYVYHVAFTTIVNPNETWVLDQTSGHALTLITCYPFYYVGSAPKRFIVRAHQGPV